MHSTVLQYLENTASQFPDKIAFADNKDAFTFEMLTDAAKRIGSGIARKVRPHNPIVVYMDKKAYNIPFFLGAAYAGCFYVPIDMHMPVERVKLILNTLKPSLVIYDKTTEGSVSDICQGFENIYYEDLMTSEIDEEALSNIRLYSKSTDLLYVLFTSGSTGVPKGVTISHAAVIDFMDWVCDKYNLSKNTTLCNQAPFYFDASVPDLYIPLKVGATVCIPPKSYYTFPKKILQYIEDNNINTLVWVPSALCNVVNCKAFEVTVPTSIKLVIFCGELMPCKHLNVWKKYVPDALYVNMYGPTEATYACMYYDVDRQFSDEDKLPLGKACENSEILLLNDSNQETEVNEMGEICILGQCLSQGYYNAPEKTATAFMQNPLNTKWIEYMYRTGDLAYKAENGDIVFAGRKDFQIKRLGHRIELGEIENAILSIEEIDNACCVYNENSSEIIAIFSGKVEEENVETIIAEKLPQYMYPNKYVKLPCLPMNLNGKIDRTKLKSEYTED